MTLTIEQAAKSEQALCRETAVHVVSAERGNCSAAESDQMHAHIESMQADAIAVVRSCLLNIVGVGTLEHSCC